MAWKDNIQDGSFRGAKFWADASDFASGRRTVTHQYPFRNVPFTEDLGREAWKIQIQAYVPCFVGNDDYMPARDALKSALEADGPGELAHPWLGSVEAQVQSFSFTEEKKRGGVAFFSVTFVEPGKKQAPSTSANMGARAVSAAAAARSASWAGAASRFSTASKPEFVVGQVRTVFSLIADSVKKAAGKTGSKSVNVAITRVSDLYAAAVETDITFSDNTAPLQAIQDVITGIAGAFEEPHKKYKQFDGTYRRVSDSKNNMLSGPVEPGAVDALLLVADAARGVEYMGGHTPMKEAIRESQKASAGLARQTALAEAARLAPFIRWATFDEAMAARARLMRDLEQEAADVENDELFALLTDLRALVADTVPSPESQLPSIVIRDIEGTLPMLRIAYNEYDDAYKFDELCAMNPVRHPGFVPSGSRLRMLVNE